VGEAGQVGGAEALIFGVLVFVVGSLAVVSSWAIVDQKLAVSAAAREAARRYVESSGGADEWARAVEAGRTAYAGYGHDPSHLALLAAPHQFVRCARVTVTAVTVVDMPRIAVVREVGRHTTVSAQHTETIDPYRSGLRGAGGNPCS
jgi:hypothetical protein